MRNISIFLLLWVIAGVLLFSVHVNSVYALAPNFGYLTQFLDGVLGVIQTLVVIVFAIAILYFFWGVSLVLRSGGDEEGLAQGKQIMLWGIIAIFVMVSIYGLIAIIGNIFFGPDRPTTIILPRIPSSTR